MRWAWLVFVLACGGAQKSGDAGGFQITYPDASRPTKAGKPFYAKPTGNCVYDNGREAHWAITGAHVEKGELPAGIAIEDGAITGTPTKKGAYPVQIKLAGVTCAGKPVADQLVDLMITVK